MSLLDTFRTEVEDYLAASRETPTKFGADAVSDPNFVFDLRAGREPRAGTIDRVRAFMASRAASPEVAA
jgi:homoserine dehydrogenase